MKSFTKISPQKFFQHSIFRWISASFPEQRFPSVLCSSKNSKFNQNKNNNKTIRDEKPFHKFYMYMPDVCSKHLEGTFKNNRLNSIYWKILSFLNFQLCFIFHFTYAYWTAEFLPRKILFNLSENWVRAVLIRF